MKIVLLVAVSLITLITDVMQFCGEINLTVRNINNNHYFNLFYYGFS